jgi:predicted Zn finger-like uncharacterized protein
MLVQCPNCKTTYKVADEVLKGAAPAFRCSRCRHTFELEAEEPSPPAAEAVETQPPSVSPPAEEQELSFSFPAKDEIATAAATGESVDIPPRIDTPPEEKIEPEVGAPDDWSLHGDEQAKAPAEAPFTLPDIEPSTPAEREIVQRLESAQEEAAAGLDEPAPGMPNILPMTSYLDQQASIMPYLTLFTLLLIAYGMAAVVTYAHPKSSEEAVKKIPLFGTAVLKNSHLKNGILLQSLRGGYQSIQGNREVFVISGVALNQNPVVIREIQLTGKLHNEAGKELEEQKVWVGNTLSAKILRGMTLEDIPHLQSLKPLKSFEMPPGDAVPFAVVFLKAGRSVKDFTCVVSFADSDI